MKNGIGLITDDRKLKGLIMPLGVADNVFLSNLKLVLSKKLKFIRWNNVKKETEKYIDLLKIKTPNANQRVESLSGGNQQKVVLSNG